MSTALKVILTGATGMVGEGVLLACLHHPNVGEVLLVNRQPSGFLHARVRELIVPDFMHLEDFTSELTGYDACFYCAGVSSVGLSEDEYTQITFEVTLNFAEFLTLRNPHMTFIYVSGSHTDSSEQGRVMWARVKGRTENALMRLPFPHVYNFRPGFMRPTPGQRNVKSYYSFIGWLYPILRAVLPKYVSTMGQVGQAMINAVLFGYPKQVLEIADINLLGDRKAE